MIVLLDNGHGAETKGKRSPDGQLLEYRFNRDITKMITAALSAVGIQSYLLCPEESDVPLSMRAKRANNMCAHYGVRNCILISIHADADANGSSPWTCARGLTSIVYDHASHYSCVLAKMITGEAYLRHLLGNRSTPACGYRRQNLAILRETACPAVLVECGFMTNHEDVAFMLSRSGKEQIVSAIVTAVRAFITTSTPS